MEKRVIYMFLRFLVVVSLLVGTLGVGTTLAAEEKEVKIRVMDIHFRHNKIPNVLELQETNPGQLASWLPYHTILNIFLNQHPEIKPELVQGYEWWAGPEVLLTQFAAGEQPCFYPPPLDNLDAAIAQGIAADITEYVKDWPLAEKIPTAIWALCWRGDKCYAVPKDKFSPWGVTYRKDYFEEAGIFDAKGEPAPPENWTPENFREICKKLTDPKKNRWGWAFHSTGVNAGWHAGEVFATAFGIPRWTPDSTLKSTWNSGPAEEWAKVFQFYKDLVFNDKTALGGIAYDRGAVLKEFNAGRTGMRWWDWTGLSGPLYYQMHKIPGVMVWAKNLGFVPAPSTAGLAYAETKFTPIVIDPTLTKEQKDAAWLWMSNVSVGPMYERTFDLVKEATGNIGYHMGFIFTPFPSDLLEVIPPQWIETHNKLKAIPVGPELVKAVHPSYTSIPFIGWNVEKEYIGKAVEAIVSNPNADPLKVAEDMVKKVNATEEFKIKQPGTSKEAFREYYTDLGNYYQENFPDYYKEYFLGYLEKYYKVW